MKNEKGISLITLVITIVVIIILAAITMNANMKPLDKAIDVKFKEEEAMIREAAEARMLLNSKDGLDEETLYRGFIKVNVENAPNGFVSFDDDTTTGYVADLKNLGLEKISIAKDYKNLKEGDTITFGETDVFIYDNNEQIYYAKDNSSSSSN